MPKLPNDGLAIILQSWCEGLRPDAPLQVDEWASQHMVIPPETGASEPGRYRVERTPYARDVMRALSPEHPARKVVVKGASQLLKTQVALNWICAIIDRQPSNIIVLEPTDKLARRVASRFDKTAQVVEAIRKKVAIRKDRDAKNTGDTKEFKGGTAWFLSARSASNLAEASARYLIVDEVDRLLRELKGEGDPVGLGEKRQTTYGRKAKGLYISSPTEEDASRIDELYREGNQHEYQVPCPHCGELQTLEWDHLHYELTPTDPPKVDGRTPHPTLEAMDHGITVDADRAGKAWMACSVNGCLIEEHHKSTMLPDEAMGGRARWKATAKGNGEIWSYHISSLYAPLGWVSWLDLAREHAEAEKALGEGDGEKMQVFFNTRLAKCWTSSTARVQPATLKSRAEHYPLGIAPNGAIIITASVDVQGNRLECQITGWGPGPSGLEAWIINTHILFGDPTLPAVWEELDAILQTPIKHAGGATVTIRAVLIDSGDGDSTQEVYEFVRRRRSRFVAGKRQDMIPIKGSSQAKKPIINRPSKIDVNYRGKAIIGGVEVWSIGTDTAKDWIYNRLALSGQNAIHTSDQLPIEFYEQLMSEVKVTKYRNGRKVSVYETLKRNTRNEQLDLLVYNLAAAHFLGIDRYTETHWARHSQTLREIDLFDTAEPQTAEPIPEKNTLPAPAKHHRQARKSFANHW